MATPGGSNDGQPEYDEPDSDPRAFARDWLALWESELSAIGADPTMREMWRCTAVLWSNIVAGIFRSATSGGNHFKTEDYPHPDRAANTPRATPAPASSDARDDTLERLTRHVASLERRLAGLEHRRGGDVFVQKRRPRGRRS